jgi:hypothetical protein
MSKFELSLLRVLAIGVILLLAGGSLWTIFRVMWLGSYWASASIVQTLFVGVIIPLIIIWVVIRLIIAITRAK